MSQPEETEADGPLPLKIPELIQEVLKYLPRKSLLAVRLVSKTWNEEVLRKVRQADKKGVNIFKNIAHIGPSFNEVSIQSINHRFESVLSSSNIPDILLHTIWIQGALKMEFERFTVEEQEEMIEGERIIRKIEREKPWKLRPELRSLFEKYGNHVRVLRLFFAPDFCIALFGQILNVFFPNLREFHLLDIKYFSNRSELAEKRLNLDLENLNTFNLKLQKLILPFPGPDWKHLRPILNLYTKILQGSPSLTYLSAPYKILSQMHQSTADSITTLIVHLNCSPIELFEQKIFKKLKLLKIVTHTEDNLIRNTPNRLGEIVDNLLNQQDALLTLDLMATDKKHFSTWKIPPK